MPSYLAHPRIARPFGRKDDVDHYAGPAPLTAVFKPEYIVAADRAD